MTKTETNIKCAELLHPNKTYRDAGVHGIEIKGSDFFGEESLGYINIYDPNKVDAYKVGEKLGITIQKRSAKILNDWACFRSATDVCHDPDQHTALVKCIEKVVNEN